MQPAPSLAAVLSDLLAFVRAVYEAEHSFHWRTRGPLFYSDHLLFSRIYEGTYGDLDAIAEKLIGLSGQNDAVAPLMQAAKTLEIMQGFQLSDDPKSFAHSALNMEKALIALVSSTLEVCQSEMTDGLENFLQGLADKHETHVYLLQQSCCQS